MKSVLVPHCALNLDFTCGQGLCLSWSSLCLTSTSALEILTEGWG